jgi:hypothetical protein
MVDAGKAIVLHQRQRSAPTYPKACLCGLFCLGLITAAFAQSESQNGHRLTPLPTTIIVPDAAPKPEQVESPVPDPVKNSATTGGRHHRTLKRKSAKTRKWE